MAVTLTLSNHFFYMLGTKEIDFSSDVFKVILMNTTFAFDKDADATLADVTSDQLATGNGYTQDTKELAGVSVSEDDTNDRLAVSWNAVVWTASGGSIGPTGAAIIYDDTTADDTVIGCIDFGEDITREAGADIEIGSIGVNIGAAA